MRLVGGALLAGLLWVGCGPAAGPGSTPAPTTTPPSRPGLNYFLKGAGSSVSYKPSTAEVRVWDERLADPLEYTLPESLAREMQPVLDGLPAALKKLGMASPPEQALGYQDGDKVVGGPLDAPELAEARRRLEALRPSHNASGPELVWVSAPLKQVEAGTWTLDASSGPLSLEGDLPADLEPGTEVVVVGSLRQDQMSAANTGPVYGVTRWTQWKAPPSAP